MKMKPRLTRLSILETVMIRSETGTLGRIYKEKNKTDVNKEATKDNRERMKAPGDFLKHGKVSSHKIIKFAEECCRP